MADASYDAIIIGGGNKALVTAIYLAKFGGMDVGMFEERHELGGGWTSEEGPAPGFISDAHSTTMIDYWYFLPLVEDFPDFEEKGAKFLHYLCGGGGIMKEDHSCLTLYQHRNDPDMERTAKEIARFSEKDAETYLKLWEVYRPGGILQNAILETRYSLPPPPGEPDAYEKALNKYLENPKCPVDYRWLRLHPYQAGRELWEHPFLRCLAQSILRANMPIETGVGTPNLLSNLLNLTFFIFVQGGTHSLAHACHRILLENRGKSFTRSEVDKVIIEDGTAKGIRLVDGTEIEARKLVVSTLSPYQLCFDLIGKEHLSSEILRKIENLERRLSCITWYAWAVHEPPKYKAAAFNPDIDQTHRVMLLTMDDEASLKEAAWRRLGKHPSEMELIVFSTHSLVDKTRVPEGKHLSCTLQNALPATALTEREWMEFKKTNAENILKVWNEYAPNMTWDNVIGYFPLTPYDTAGRLKNMAPTGAHVIIDEAPGQSGKFRPIAEFASHRTPIKNLYATGSAWPPAHGACCCQGYRCYKAIAEDFGLEKHWVKNGRPW